VKKENDQKGNRPYPVEAGNHLSLLLQFRMKSLYKSLNYSLKREQNRIAPILQFSSSGR
jgi:hypothetical protein